jgi:hypothetical protein
VHWSPIKKIKKGKFLEIWKLMQSHIWKKVSCYSTCVNIASHCEAGRFNISLLLILLGSQGRKVPQHIIDFVSDLFQTSLFFNNVDEIYCVCIYPKRSIIGRREEG